jgi:hypothetical protein
VRNLGKIGGFLVCRMYSNNKNCKMEKKIDEVEVISEKT